MGNILTSITIKLTTTNLGFGRVVGGFWKNHNHRRHVLWLVLIP